MTMRTNTRTFATMIAVVATVAGAANASETAQLKRAKELQWSDIEAMPGGKFTALWSEGNAGAVLMRWPSTTKLPSVTREHDVHIVVLAGTVTFDIAGGHKQIGPGGFADIPKGIAHALGCESSGECVFLMHAGGGKQ